MTDSSTEEFDLVVLGAGTGGYSAALRAADLGLSVAIVERDRLGGTCLNRGCIPTKALLHAAELVDGIREGSERWGVRATLDTIDYTAMSAARDDIVDRNVRGLEGHLRNDGVRIVAASGRLTGRDTVLVEGGATLRARRGIVLATGSVPSILPGLTVDGTRILTSDEALELDHVPESVVVVGGGSVGVEFASIWASLGARVTLVELMSTLLPLEDEDLGRELGRALKRRGVEVLTGSRLGDVTLGEGSVTAVIETPSGSRTVSAACLLSAAGRSAVTADLGYHEAGIHVERGHVLPANWSTLETHVPGVYVVGDLLPPPSPALAHASFAEGLRVAEHIAGRRPYPFDYAWVPRATYSSPEVAAVGMTERAAREAGHDIEVNRMPFAGVARGLMLGQGGFVKVVAERGGEVLGIHMIGARVTELVAEAMLIRGWSAGADDVAYLIHPHPTLSEAVGEAHMTLAGRRLHQVVLRRAGASKE